MSLLHTCSRSLPVALAITLLAAGPVLAAPPRDEALRVAPPDAALVLVVQDTKTHLNDLAASPFVAWLPTSGLGKQLLPVVDVKTLKGSVAPLFAELGVTPDELLDDVIGDAVVFAFTPPPPDDPQGERAVLLVRPRKPETLAKLIDRVNAIQTKNGEVKEVVRRTHNGEAYYERQKPGAGERSEFYCFRGGVFAFSSSEADIQAVIDRDRAAEPVGEKAPALTARLARLGVADSFAVLLVNPRSFDAEVKHRVETAKPEERPVLERFQEVWGALDTAAVYLALGRDLELGVSVRFQPDRLPAATRTWLAGPRTPAGLWSAIPDDALFAVAGRFRAAELIETITTLLPEDGKAALKTAIEQYLGPVVGRDKLPLVLDSLGPDWGLWAVQPANGAGFLPSAVAAVQVSGEGDAGRVLLDAVDYGFRTIRVAYNAAHADQIDLKETRDGDVVIRSLVNDKAFPPGFRPSFALKGGYLLVATSPEAIKSFTPPARTPGSGGEVPVIRFSGTATRAYLLANRTKLAKFLSQTGNGDEVELLQQIDQIAAVLEPIDRVELSTRGDADGLRLAVRVRFVKPLKK
jgi:hypothetical protein